MLRSIALLFSLFLFSNVWAQTVEYGEEKGSFQEQQFVDAYDYLFMTKEPAKSLFKLNLVNSLPNTTVIGQDFVTPLDLRMTFGLTFEQKLSNVLSVNFSVIPFYQRIVYINFLELPDNDFSLGFTLEPRWYYDMRKRILQSRSANNLSGNYLGLRLGGFWDSSILPDDSNILNLDRIMAQFQIGQQRRIFKRAFFDISASLGTLRRRVYTNRDFTEYFHKWSFLYGLEVSLGMAIGGEVNKAPDAVHCDAFRCHIEERSMLKIGLLRLLSGSSTNGFNGEIDLEYEHKLGYSSWSMTYSGVLDYFISTNVDDTPGDVIRTGYSLGFAPRWYYNLKKRIAKGKTANNLSSNYFTLSTSFSSRAISNFGGEKFRDYQIAVVPAWGVQRRFFNRGYFDYKVGFGPATDRRRWDLTEESPSYFNRSFFDKIYYIFLSELKIGLAF
ncbi:MAG: hypothetical protein AAFV95_26710 [Bacteroidota bacterium]